MTTITDIDAIISQSPSNAGVRHKLVAEDGATMQASIWSVEPGSEALVTIPSTSDGYFFILRGTGSARDGGQAQALKPQVFAIAGQGSEIRFANSGSGSLDFLHIVSPPPGSGAVIDGYNGPLKLVPAETVGLVHEPENKKKRAFFVGPKAIPSGRAEGLIVHYEKETITRPHFHPDADSIFVVLEGELEFTNDREEGTIRPGQVVFINKGHRHGTRVTQGHDSAAFLEFHVPAKFQTIQDP